MDGYLSNRVGSYWTKQQLKQNRGFVSFSCDKEVRDKLLLVLVQQLTDVRVRVAPEVPLAFPLGSKMVAAAPPKKTKEMERGKGHTILILLPFKELLQMPSNFYLHLTGQAVSYL